MSAKINRPIKKCANCGSHHIKIYSWITARGRAFYFCSMQCKREFKEVGFPDLEKKEKEREEAEESVLPKMRTLVARKESNGVTIVRGDD